MDDDFATLYATYAGDLYRFALHLSGEPADAEDIVSETFVRAWTARVQERATTVKGYLYAIARNVFLQSRRRTTRHVALENLELTAHAPGPATRAEERSELAATLAALQRLPEIDRAALVMRAFDEMPYEEIARALGLTLAATKVKIHRARLALGTWRAAREAPGKEPS